MRMKSLLLTPGHALCGDGSLITLWTQTLYSILNGMHRRFQRTPRMALHEFMVNHGLVIVSGTFRYVCGKPDYDMTLINEKSSLPEDAKMLCLEIYADKTQLSSFGTEKGYPVMARIANLPAKIRNGEGLGGGRVVGWLPIVSP